MTYKRLASKDYKELLSSLSDDNVISTNGNGKVRYVSYFDNSRNVIIALFYSEIKPKFFGGLPVKYHNKFLFDKKKIKMKTTKKFLKVFNSVKSIVRDDIQSLIRQYPLAQIEIVGTKFGSVLAQLAAQDLYKNYLFRSNVITFETIPTFFGNDDLKKYLKSCCKGRPDNWTDSEKSAKFWPYFPGYFTLEDCFEN